MSSFSILKDRLLLYWDSPKGPELVIDVTHPKLANVMWLSFGSPFVSYWTIYCDPRGISDPPKAVPPECLANDNEDFNGTLSVTSSGRQCIPWVDDIAIPEEYQKVSSHFNFLCNNKTLPLRSTRTSLDSVVRSLRRQNRVSELLPKSRQRSKGPILHCERQSGRIFQRKLSSKIL